MKSCFQTVAARAVLLLASALSLPGPALAANQVSLQPSVSSLLPGQTVEITLTGADFKDMTLGGGVQLQWNPDVLDLDSVVVDATAWEFARSGGVLDAAAGTLSDLYFASFAGRSGGFAIATLRFVADKPGQSDVSLTEAPFFPFSDANGDIMGITYTGTSLLVSAVPEPTGGLLLVAGLCGLARLRRVGLRSDRA
jgi:hypothetical protein